MCKIPGRPRPGAVEGLDSARSATELSVQLNRCVLSSCSGIHAVCHAALRMGYLTALPIYMVSDTALPAGHLTALPVGHLTALPTVSDAALPVGHLTALPMVSDKALPIRSVIQPCLPFILQPGLRSVMQPCPR